MICYDNGCRLWKYARQTSRKDITPTSKKLADVEIVIDKMHMAGHVDEWYKKNCDPYKIPHVSDTTHTYMYKHILTLYFLQVDTEICEQTFSWLSRYARTCISILSYLIYICDLHNEREEKKLNNSNYM